MNRTIKEATVKRYHYDCHEQLAKHLSDFINAYNYARRLKTLKGLTPYEYICKTWTAEPKRFTLNPLQQMPGLNRIVSRWCYRTQPLERDGLYSRSAKTRRHLRKSARSCSARSVVRDGPTSTPLAPA